MKQEKIDQLRRMLSLINHKESKKIKVNETAEKAIKSGVLNEIEDFDVADFGFGELEKEKPGFDVSVGADPKYYAEQSVNEEAPKANRTIFSIPFRCWMLGMTYGQIGLKVNSYNSQNPDNPIEFDEEQFKKLAKPSLGLLGDAIKMNELNKYSLEFYARVASKKLNPKEEAFDKATGAFSSAEAVSFAQKMLDKWIYTVVTDQVRKSTKATFKDEVDIRVFDEGKEKGKETINDIIQGKSKIEFNPKRGNFNALAVEVMKNSVKNAFIKYGKSQIIGSGDFYNTVQNLSFPYNLKTTARYSSILNSAYAKKLEKKNLTNFTAEDWETIKKETNSSFAGVPKINISDNKVYLTFTYNNPDDLISDLISANESQLSGKEDSISYSPVYYNNILDKELKNSVFKSLFSPSGRNIDAMMGAVELKPKQPAEGDYEEIPYDDDMEYNIEREKDFPAEFEFPGVEQGVSRDKIVDFLKSEKFINQFTPFAKQFSDKRLFPIFNRLSKPEFQTLFSKYPNVKEEYKNFLGEMLYYSLMEIPDEAGLKNQSGLKNQYLNTVKKTLSKLRKTVSRKDINSLKDLFSLNDDYIKGLNRFKTILTKDIDTKTKRKIFSDLLSEAKRAKKLASILKEFSFVINEAEASEVDTLIGSLTGSGYFAKEFAKLNEKEKSLFIEKTVDLLSGKFARTQRFGLKLPVNKLVMSLLLYVLTSSSITNENMKKSALSALMAIIYNKVELLKFIAKQGISRSTAGIEYKDTDFDYKYEDVVLNSVTEKLQEIKNSDKFDPTKSEGLTWLNNILINDVTDYFKTLEGKAMLKTRSLDAPKPSTGKAAEIGDEEENKFQWFQKDDDGILSPAETESGEETVLGTTTLEPGSGRGFEKMLQSISSKLGFGLKQFVKNNFSKDKIFSYEKGGREYYILGANNEFYTMQDMALFLLEFMSGKGEPEYYSVNGDPKYSNFIDYVIKDKGAKLYSVSERKTFDLDDLDSESQEGNRPRRAVIHRMQDSVRKLIMDKIASAKKKGSVYESVRKEINPIIKKYFLIKESKKKDIELEEERIANSDGKEKVDNKENFIGSQVFGEDIGGIGEESGWKDGMYGVFSYGLQFPIYLYTNEEFEDQDGNKKNKDGKFRWFHNLEDYKFDIDEDGESEVMKSVQKHKELLKPSASTHGLTRATLLGLIKKFMSKNKIQKLSHTSILPGEGAGIHYGDSDHQHDKRKES